MYNLVQYYLNNEPAERLKILYWLRVLLSLSQQTGSHAICDEVYATLCLLGNDRNQLEAFLAASA
jgi:hypothetical protein